MADDSCYSLEDYEKKTGRRTRRVMNAIFAALVIAVAVVVAWFAWNWLRPPDITAYATETVQLVGLEEEAIEITPEQLAELSCHSVQATNESERAGQGVTIEKTAYGYGPTLDEVIGQWGYTLEDFDRVVVRCQDGYEVVILPNDTLEGEVYLSIASGKDALPEDMRPMRLIMPDMAPGQWAYGIESITFEVMERGDADETS